MIGDKVILVAGAAGGIGLAMARSFARTNSAASITDASIPIDGGRGEGSGAETSSTMRRHAEDAVKIINSLPVQRVILA